MAEPFLEKYPCPQCEGLHDDYYDARDCCSNKIEKVYVCVKCYSEDDDAAEHFLVKDSILAHLKECDAVDEFSVLEQELIQRGVNRVDIENYRDYRDSVDSETRKFRRLAGTSPFAQIEAIAYA